MEGPNNLAILFSRELAEPLRSGLVLVDLEETLCRIVLAAKAQWSELSYPEAAFVTDLARRLPEGTDIQTHLQSLPAADIYLAYACARGDSTAVAAFEASYSPVIDRALFRLVAQPDTVDEVKQILRERFFVGCGDQAPAMGSYLGYGSLRAWVRVSALREYYGLSQQRSLQTEDTKRLQRASSSNDVELGFFKEHYKGEINAALAGAIVSLRPKQRTLLKQHYLDGLRVRQLGELYQVHRVTVSRWLAKAREQVIAQTRRTLMGRLGVDQAEFESILRLVRSQIDLSIRTYLSQDLGPSHPGEPPIDK
jgi:RNA polymerase sigma-70 factor, ECF subfamily